MISNGRALPVVSDPGLSAHFVPEFPTPELERHFAEAASAPPAARTVQKVAVLLNRNDEVKGTVVVRGGVHFRQICTPEGTYQQLVLSWPRVLTWGRVRCEFIRRKAVLACIADYAGLCEQLPFPISAKYPVLSFEGGWEPEMVGYQQGIARAALKAMFGGRDAAWNAV